ncbi:MAG: CPBP family intramembrane metalloprotease, partial [Clostridium sp.]|nr:CPBP family intramembrane metalloprotease [Clostridium sp.]
MREIFTSRQSKNQRNIQVLMIFVVVIAMLLMDRFLTLPYTTRSIYKVLLFLLFPIILGGSIRWFDLFSVFRVKSDDKKIFPSLFLGLGVYVLLILLYIILKDIFNLEQIMGALESTVAVTKDNFIMVAIYISFINSFLEEFFFRGFAYLKLKDKMPKIGATMISAMAFSIYHFSMVEGWASPILVALGLLG